MLEVRNLESGYGASQVLFGMNLAINSGEVVTLVGRNGMGKTTTVRTIMGLLPARKGSVLFEGRPIERRPSFQVARLGLGLVPEGRHIFPNLTVRENLVATASNRLDNKDPWTLDKVVALFPRLGERIGNMGNQLSGGEQQMLAVSRALMTNPKLLILDEATEGLAPLIRDEIWSCLDRLKQLGQAILVIDKHLEKMLKIADRHYVVEKGKVVFEGSSALFRERPDIREKYVGF